MDAFAKLMLYAKTLEIVGAATHLDHPRTDVLVGCIAAWLACAMQDNPNAHLDQLHNTLIDFCKPLYPEHAAELEAARIGGTGDLSGLFKQALSPNPSEG